jgi:hypothetical protein
MSARKMIVSGLIGLLLSGCAALDTVGRYSPGLGVVAAISGVAIAAFNSKSASAAANEQARSSTAQRERTCLGYLADKNVFLNTDCQGFDRRDLCIRVFESRNKTSAPAVCVALLRSAGYRIG